MLIKQARANTDILRGVLMKKLITHTILKRNMCYYDVIIMK